MADTLKLDRAGLDSILAELKPPPIFGSAAEADSIFSQALTSAVSNIVCEHRPEASALYACNALAAKASLKPIAGDEINSKIALVFDYLDAHHAQAMIDGKQLAAKITCLGDPRIGRGRLESGCGKTGIG